MVVFKKSKREIKYIVVHCSATKEGYPFFKKDINRWHKARGWKGIGYNYVIDLNGNIETGRDVNQIPAHVKGYNRHSIGVVYIGGVDDNLKAKDTRTKAQKESLLCLLKQLKSIYPDAVIQGHRDFPGVQKACPSFNAKREYTQL